MQIVIRGGGREREVVVDHAPDAVVGDLLRAAGMDDTPGVDVDGRYVDASEELATAPIPDGAVVTAAAPHGPPDRPRPRAPAWVSVVAGREAGARFPLAPGTLVVGRGPDCDVHLDAATDLRPARRGPGRPRPGRHRGGRSGPATARGSTGSRSPPPRRWPPGDTLRVGALVLRLDGPDPEDLPSGIDRHLHPGPIPFNRPPRPVAAPAPRLLAAPAAAGDDHAAQPLRIAAMLAPVALGHRHDRR